MQRALLLSLAFLLGCGPVRLKLVDDQTMDMRLFDGGTAWAQARFGGVSGLAWDASTSTLYALSDAHGPSGPPRWFSMSLALSADSLAVGEPSARILDVPPDADLEAIARDGDTVWVASEAQGLYALDGLGTSLAERLLPEAYRNRHWDKGPTWRDGPRPNLGLESLTRLPDGSLLACTEETLIQDGERTHLRGGSRVRLLRLGRDGSIAEAWYETDPLPRSAWRVPDTRRCNLGVSDLLALDARRVLVLERGWDSEQNQIRIYQIDLLGAFASGLEGEPLAKQLVLDLEDIRQRLEPDVLGRERLDNFEAMALGPELNGQRTLLLASDDNFAGLEGRSSQRTLLLAFIIEE